MNLQEMETATRLNLDLVVIIWINNSLGLVEWGDLTYALNQRSTRLKKYIKLTDHHLINSLNVEMYARLNRVLFEGLDDENVSVDFVCSLEIGWTSSLETLT